MLSLLLHQTFWNELPKTVTLSEVIDFKNCAYHFVSSLLLCKLADRKQNTWYHLINRV